jgi:hypothetical protein
MVTDESQTEKVKQPRVRTIRSCLTCVLATGAGQFCSVWVLVATAMLIPSTCTVVAFTLCLPYLNLPVSNPASGRHVSFENNS